MMKLPVSAPFCRIALLPALAGLLASNACDAQVDPGYEGEPLAEIRGSVVVDEEPEGAASAAILWFTSGDAAQCSGPAAACAYGFGGDEVEALECAQACEEPVACAEESFAAWATCVQACGLDTAEYEIFWEPCATGAVGAQVPITGSFPASFELDIFDTPPDEAVLTDQDGVAVAFGWIMAVEDGAALEFDFAADDVFAGVLGVAPRHALIYAASEVPADSRWGEYLGGSFAAGFHIVENVGGVVECEPGVPESPDTCASTIGTLRPAPADLATEIELQFGPIWRIGAPL